jgi:uncharacterized protein YbjQ (UPF0145 family)
MVQTVFKVRVVTRDMITDFFARFRSILGGRVKAYEKAIQEAIDDAYADLKKEYPNIQNVRFGTTEMLSDACEIILYGEVTDDEYKRVREENERRDS